MSHSLAPFSLEVGCSMPYIYDKLKNPIAICIEGYVEDDASLLVAAPELLDVLESFPGFDTGSGKYERDWLVKLNAAIGKARGGKSDADSYAQVMQARADEFHELTETSISELEALIKSRGEK